MYRTSAETVADPGFSRGGGANSRGGGTPTYDFAKISKKLHEMKEFGPRGVCASKILLCRSATEDDNFLVRNYNMKDLIGKRNFRLIIFFLIKIYIYSKKRYFSRIRYFHLIYMCEQ